MYPPKPLDLCFTGSGLTHCFQNGKKIHQFFMSDFACYKNMQHKNVNILRFSFLSLKKYCEIIPIGHEENGLLLKNNVHLPHF